jgi:3-hydroxybutyryl-CoA dehydratase
VRAGDTVRATVSVRELVKDKRLVWLNTVCTVKETVVITGEALVKVGSRA